VTSSIGEKQPFIPARLSHVADLQRAIEESASGYSLHHFDVTGFGVFDWVELDASDGHSPSRRFAGPLTATAISGRVRGEGESGAVLFGTFFREAEAGMECAGGRITAGSVVWAELRFLPFEEIDHPATTGAFQTGHSAWEKLAAESKRQEKSASINDTGDEDLRPESGDRVHHQQFGDCTVVKLTDDHILLQKSDSRIVQLGLPVLKFEPAGKDGRHTIWNVSIKK